MGVNFTFHPIHYHRMCKELSHSWIRQIQGNIDWIQWIHQYCYTSFPHTRKHKTNNTNKLEWHKFSLILLLDWRWFHKNEYLLSVTLPINCYFNPRCTNNDVIDAVWYISVACILYSDILDHLDRIMLMLIRIIQYISNFNYLRVVENTIDFQFHLCVLETCHSAYFNNTVNQTKMCGMLLSTAFKNAFVNEIMWCNIIIIRD